MLLCLLCRLEWQVPPVDGGSAFAQEVIIGLGEMLAAKVASMARKWRRVHRLQYQVLLLLLIHVSAAATCRWEKGTGKKKRVAVGMKKEKKR